jgi:hypothetical protein
MLEEVEVLQEDQVVRVEVETLLRAQEMVFLVHQVEEVEVEHRLEMV